MVDDVARWLFDPSGLTPHGFCLLWEPGLIWLHALSDIGIGVAYFTIPMALAVFARRRRDLVFRPVFFLFAAFIMLCGTGHLLDVLTLWVPAYWADGLVKAATAIVSIITAVALWVLLPQALALPSPGQMREANAALLASEDRLRQAQKMEAVGQLTGGIAHDFNNMLQGIAGGLELMQRRIAQGRPQEAAQFVALAQQSVTRAAALTHRMLAFARRQALNPRPVEPDILVRGIADLIQRTVGPGVQLVLRLHDGSTWRSTRATRCPRAAR
jgi:signal transduction histidine kinase